MTMSQKSRYFSDDETGRKPTVLMETQTDGACLVEAKAIEAFASIALAVG